MLLAVLLFFSLRCSTTMLECAPSWQSLIQWSQMEDFVLTLSTCLIMQRIAEHLHQFAFFARRSLTWHCVEALPLSSWKMVLITAGRNRHVVCFFILNIEGGGKEET